MNKTFILGFNYDECKEYIRKNPGNYIILSRIEQLLGTVNPEVKILPNAYRRKDYMEFIVYIRTRQR